jgi:beta-glucosidase
VLTRSASTPSSAPTDSRAVTLADHYRRYMVVQGKPVQIELPPGLKLEQGPSNQVAHHAVLAHGLGVQAIRAAGRQGTEIGPAEVLFAAVPVIDLPEHVRAAETATCSLAEARAKSRS